eukprot:3421271-Prymnesium_polylepis.2
MGEISGCSLGADEHAREQLNESAPRWSAPGISGHETHRQVTRTTTRNGKVRRTCNTRKSRYPASCLPFRHPRAPTTWVPTARPARRRSHLRDQDHKSEHSRPTVRGSSS